MFLLAGTVQLRIARQRRPGRYGASLIPLLALGVVPVAVPVMVDYEDHELSAEGVNGMDNANAVVIVPLILMLYFWLFKSGAIRRWIPARPDNSAPATYTIRRNDPLVEDSAEDLDRLRPPEAGRAHECLGTASGADGAMVKMNWNQHVAATTTRCRR